MRFGRFCFGIVLSALCLTGMVSCSSGPKPVAEKKAEMPTDYPTEGKQTLLRLQAYLPESSDALLVTSYGSLADAIQQFRKWNLVDDKEIENALKDLSMHYLLNPTTLKDYYKAGMNTGSGFAVGLYGQNVFILFDVIDAQKFRAWLDNFMNEEFGRPRYHESQEGNVTLSEIRILDSDYGTLVVEAGKPVILVLGEGLGSGGASMEAAKAILADKKLSKSRCDAIANMMSSAPIAAWGSTSGRLAEIIPEQYRAYTDSVSDIVIDINLMPQGPSVHLQGKLKSQGAVDGVSVSALAKGSNAGWGNAIMSPNPTSAFRILFDAKQLEALALPMLSEKTQNQYNDIKQKLTQKLLNIDISDQIIYNIGGAWVTLYQARVPDTRDPSLEDILFAQNGVVYLPLKNASKSDAFFAKLNILKRVIPEDKASIETEDGVLHAVVNLGGNKKLHAGYYKGLLAVTTANGWEKAAETLKNTEAADSPSILAKDSHFVASHIAVSDVIDILGARFSIIKEQLTNFFEPVNDIRVQASADENALDILIHADLKN